MTGGLSKADKLLIAAYHLEASGMSRFSAEDLAVAAWREFPDAFALTGYPEHPDSNRVYFEIMGNKTFRKKGWLEKVGQKKYRLSATGRGAALDLAAASPDNQAGSGRIALGREDTDRLQRLWNSTATSKIRENRREELVFLDASSFWAISPRSTASQLSARLRSVETLLQKAAEVTERVGPISIEHGRVILAADSVTLLLQVHSSLQLLFKDELDLIGKRTDERRPTSDIDA